MLIWGIHTHVGISDKERVWPIINALLTKFPHLLALTESYWQNYGTLQFVSDMSGKGMCDDENYLAYLRQVFQIPPPAV